MQVPLPAPNLPEEPEGGVNSGARAASEEAASGPLRRMARQGAVLPVPARSDGVAGIARSSLLVPGWSRID